MEFIVSIFFFFFIVSIFSSDEPIAKKAKEDTPAAQVPAMVPGAVPMMPMMPGMPGMPMPPGFPPPIGMPVMPGKTQLETVVIILKKKIFTRKP